GGGRVLDPVEKCNAAGLWSDVLDHVERYVRLVVGVPAARMAGGAGVLAAGGQRRVVEQEKPGLHRTHGLGLVFPLRGGREQQRPTGEDDGGNDKRTTSNGIHPSPP